MKVYVLYQFDRHNTTLLDIFRDVETAQANILGSEWQYYQEYNMWLTDLFHGYAIEEFELK